jgi:hypothetical protein
MRRLLVDIYVNHGDEDWIDKIEDDSIEYAFDVAKTLTRLAVNGTGPEDFRDLNLDATDYFDRRPRCVTVHQLYIALDGMGSY